MNSLDDMVAPDHPVRLLDALIDRIIDTAPEFFNHLAPQSSVGRRGYSAAALIKLYMYGYIHSISSSRKLEAEAGRNIELIWLVSGLTPSYKTIADYRRDHLEQLGRVNEQVVRFMIDSGWISGERLGFDGTKLKAYTGWEMSEQKSLEKQLERARRQMEEWLRRLAENDVADELVDTDSDHDEFGDEAEVMREIDRLHQKIERLEGLKKELECRGVNHISAADPDARLMRSARAGKYPAYNVQLSVDSAHKMIVAGQASDQPTDGEQLLPVYWLSVERLGRTPAEVLADTGYADLGDIQAIEDQTPTRCYIPENNTSKSKQPIQFSYAAEQDRYICSQGRPLEAVAKGRYNKRKKAYVDVYRGIDCNSCGVSNDCTKASDGIRMLRVFHGAEWRHEYGKRLSSRYGKQRIRERKQLVEHVFGTLRYWMGQIPLKLRGIQKVQAEIDLYSSGYNLKRWFTLDSFEELMKQVTNWNSRPTHQLG